jgi:hypothetical protein
MLINQNISGKVYGKFKLYHFQMKKSFEIIIISILLLLLADSWIIEKKSELIPGPSPLSGTNNDSMKYARLLKVDSFNLTIIPPSSGIQFYREGVVFLAFTKDERKMVADHVSFGTPDTYYAVLNDSAVGNHMLFSSSASFPYPCEAMTFSSDYNTMYFTKVPKKDKKGKIFASSYTSEGKKQPGWETEESPLNCCTENASYSHPALSSDGKVIIFASDMAGSLGGMDLFITRKDGNEWSSPINLGSSVNTKGNEFFPFIDSENNLYFSSDGLSGYGGYDIYSCRFNGEKWDQPVNLSGLLNSEDDDIAFTISRNDEKNAFFSKRKKDAGEDVQLYRVTINKEAKDVNLLTISNAINGSPVSKASLSAMSIFKRDTTLKTEVTLAEYKTRLLNKEVISQPLKKVKLAAVVVPVTTPDTIPEKKTVVAPPPKVKPPEAKVVIIKPTVETPEDQKDVVIYRVQYYSGIRQLKDLKITVDGQSYTAYEYFYLGEYRYTIGEFKSVAPAIELQKTMRKTGYPQAFVAAFKNNTRSLDLKLFK